jgi:hypothetical protein
MEESAVKRTSVLILLAIIVSAVTGVFLVGQCRSNNAAPKVQIGKPNSKPVKYDWTAHVEIGSQIFCEVKGKPMINWVDCWTYYGKDPRLEFFEAKVLASPKEEYVNLAPSDSSPAKEGRDLQISFINPTIAKARYLICLSGKPNQKCSVSITVGKSTKTVNIRFVKTKAFYLIDLLGLPGKVGFKQISPTEAKTIKGGDGR